MAEEVEPASGNSPTSGGHTDLKKEEKNWAIFAHLSGLVGAILPFGNIFAPLLIWLIKKDESSYVDHHGKEAVNFQICWTVYLTVASLSIFVFIGLILAPIVGIAGLVLMINASIKASNGQEYRYPLIFRLVT